MKQFKKKMFAFLLCLFLAISCGIPMTVKADAVQDEIMAAEVNEPAENPPENQTNGNSNENNIPSASPMTIIVGGITLFVVFKATLGTTRNNKAGNGKILCHYCRQPVSRDAMICPYCRKNPRDGWFTDLIMKGIGILVVGAGVLWFISWISGR